MAEKQGESTSAGRIRQNMIDMRIQQLRNYQNQGFLTQEEVNNVVDNLLTTGTREAEIEFFQQARRLIRQGNENMEQQISRYTTQTEEQPQGESKSETQGESKSESKITTRHVFVENPGGSYSVGFRGRELERVVGHTLGTTILDITAQQQGGSEM